MPSTNSRTQKLTTVGSSVTIEVTYKAVFSPLERHLAANGLVFQERIKVIGDDSGTATDQTMHLFPVQNIPVSAGATALTVPRTRSLTVPRSSLQEDTGGDADEILCNIEIAPIGLPTTISAVTPAGSLLG